MLKQAAKTWSPWCSAGCTEMTLHPEDGASLSGTEHSRHRAYGRNMLGIKQGTRIGSIQDINPAPGLDVSQLQSLANEVSLGSPAQDGPITAAPGRTRGKKTHYSSTPPDSRQKCFEPRMFQFAEKKGVYLLDAMVARDRRDEGEDVAMEEL
ncbi:hypothetical protein EYF80_033302 [Liparis tanakae]|uniref:Uncharacterized protein n=1 Tax=Liparis tanakae TaxID=230148 RepID=A0A4Z2GTP9_9TELE|nr:hypothetical protein EYF80_033302 [Liparis tanakae]